MGNEAKVTAVLEDLAGRRQPIVISVACKRFVAALPNTIGAFVFDRTEDTTPEGYRIFRQTAPPRPGGVVDAEAAKAAMKN
jgi:hypothetical protein